VEENSLIPIASIHMSIDSRIESALQSPNPYTELRFLVKNLFLQGQSRESVLALFEETRRQMRIIGREADEDIVMDIMDCLTGWCSSHAKL
jgi:hypothetical protein